MTDLAAVKRAARAAAAEVRAAAARAAPADAGARLAEHALAAAPELVTGMPVSAFLSIRSEIDTGPLLQRLAALGARPCVPVIAARGLPLRFRAWSPGEALEPGPFGVAVPAAGDWLEPEVLFVPLLAFDAAGYRLGYGGGFYDRTLALLRGRRPTRAIGVGYAAQQVEAVPRDDLDARLDAVATEAGVLRPR